MHSCLIIDFYGGKESGASHYAILVTSEKMMLLFVNENGHSNYSLLIHLEYYVLHFINILPQASNIHKEKQN